jgi:uncharacterized protein YecT (DUF1311 family)
MAAVCLTACGAVAPKANCAGDAARDVIANIITGEIEKSALAELRGMDGAPSSAKVRATVALFKVSLDDIRTTKNDPNSTKKFCEAKLKVVVPLSIVDDADRVRGLLDMSNVAELAEAKGVERSADTFSYDATYSIQPTDDKKKVYGELDTPGDQLGFFGEILALHLIAPQVVARQQSAAAEAEAAAAAEAERLSAQAQADLALAQEENKLVTQTINEIWNTLPEYRRSELLDLQRAWIRKKAADCNIRAAEATTEPTAKEAVRLRCDTQITQQRAAELRSLLE